MALSRRIQSRVLAGVVLGTWTLLLPVTTTAQLPQARLYALFPEGAQVGTTVAVSLTRGDDLDETTRLLFNHPGIVATPQLRDVNGVQEPVPNQFDVRVAPDVEPGRYEVRAVGLYGVSNPRAFVVGAAPEILEVEPNNAAAQATPAAPGQTLNGRINGATDVDFYKFTCTAGQRIILDCATDAIDSRLDASIQVFNAVGKRLGAARGEGEKNAVLDFIAPADGEYFARVTDFVYAGSEDHFYRLSLRTGPYVDFVLPPAGVAGSTAQYTLYGRNLPEGQPSPFTLDGKPLQQRVVSITLPADSSSLKTATLVRPFASGIDGFSYFLPSPQGPSNEVFIGFAPRQVGLEVEPNNVAAQTQVLTVPAEIGGQFQAKGDVDLYQFDAQAGEVVWIEVQGQRLGSGSDPYLTLDQVTKNDKGEETLKRISAVDDDATNLLPIVFDTLTDDPVLKFAAPANGTYRIALRDRYSAARGSPALTYRLSLRREAPDFRAVVVTDGLSAPNQKQPQTWSIGIRKGDSFPLPVAILRQDGFEGDVTVSVTGLPAGVTCPEIAIGPKPSTGTLVFTAAEDAAPWTGMLEIIASARIEDPAKVAALVAAQAGSKSAQDAVAAAEKALVKPADDLAKAQAALTAAQAELAAKPDDEALKKKVTDTQAAVATATQAAAGPTQAKAAADQKLAEAQEAVRQAQVSRDMAARQVQRAGRVGTIVWNGQQNIPGKGRISSGLALSVLDEAAPFQLLQDVRRVVANHNRQILIPVKLVRRNGFDGNVTLTFVGQPQNVQVEAKPINKGADSELLRVFVPPNAPVGTYVLHLVGQSQVSYRKNPQKADRLKAALDAADKQAAMAVETQKSAATQRDEAVKKLAAEQTALQQLAAAKVAADKAVSDAQAAEKAASDAVTSAGDNADAKAVAEKKLADAQTATKTAVDAAQKAEQARVDADGKVKAAEKGKADAEAAVKAADDQVKATAAAKMTADQKFKDADNVAKAKNIAIYPPTPPLVLTIKPAPYTLAVTPANGGALKRGEKVEVKVEVKRQNGFAGPVTLVLPVPPNVSGIKAEPVVIPPDQTTGTLVVEALAEATEGQLPNLVVEGQSQFDGDAAVDQPVTIKVSP